MARATLIAKTAAEIAELLAPVVDRPFRAAQISSWILERNAGTFEEMSNLPKRLREELAERFDVADPEVLETEVSGDGSTKSLFRFTDGTTVEAVAMPLAPGRLTMCLSSQAGCAVGCKFCVTGALGAGRNLTAAEIVGQFRSMARRHGEGVERFNLVFMGMGEPLLNTAHLGQALEVLYQAVSPRRITVSTSGIVPGIRWLAAAPRRPLLAISLNAPDQERRVEIMPISAQYPLEDLMSALEEFPLERGRRITFEYVLIDGFNDSPEDARMVARLAKRVPSKVNVIPLNEDPIHLPGLKRPPVEVIGRFGEILAEELVTVTVRWSKGDDVAAACGRLKGRHQRRTRDLGSGIPV